MDETGEYHSEQGSPGSEDQKSYVFPHMQTLDLGKLQQCGWTWILGSHDKGRAHTGSMGIGKKPKT
jgi:hypothetical protein